MAKKIEWTDAARADVRRIDRETAMRILECLARFLFTDEGNVKLLKDLDPKEYRLRVGDYRVRFHDLGETLQILSVRHRREAYR
jgi:mRNA-degrading endonuclease RelE of RelBE toxin-antitoxin system